MREVLFSLPRRIAVPPPAATDASRWSTRHFALFGYRTVAERDLIRRRMEGKFGLQAVFYRIVPTADGKAYRHDHLLSLLEALGREVIGQHALGQDALVESGPPGGRVYPSASDAPTRRAAVPDPTVERAAGGDSLVVSADGDSLVPPGLESDGEDPFDLDPNKGAFGGSATCDGLELLVSRIEEHPEWVEFDLEVRPSQGVDFKGAVTFHYHPTFTPRTEAVAISRRRARTTLEAVGAFTVGAEYRGKRLELDLSEDGNFPKWFRES